MPAWAIVLIVIAAAMVAAIIILYRLGKKAEKRKAEQDELVRQTAQSVSLLIIDKKKMKLKDAGLPQAVLEQTPKLMRNAKMPVVKAKIGPQVMSLIADTKIFDDIPVRKEVKAVISGIYITDVKGLHGKSEPKPVKKKSKYAQFVEKLQEKAGAKPLK